MISERRISSHGASLALRALCCVLVAQAYTTTPEIVGSSFPHFLSAMKEMASYSTSSRCAFCGNKMVMEVKTGFDVAEQVHKQLIRLLAQQAQGTGSDKRNHSETSNKQQAGSCGPVASHDRLLAPAPGGVDLHDHQPAAVAV